LGVTVFIDRVRIRVTAGNGGKGCCSFRREKYIPFGGPDGGDGGDGGNIVFVATSRLTSLTDLRYHAHLKAESGIHGKGKDMHGRRGVDTVVPVPQGTLVYDFESGELIADLVQEGQQCIVAKGGRGGRGNSRFTTSKQRAPKFAEKGDPGEDRELRVELKLLAEVGIVGLPNAGKSTLLSVISAATPKVADYPFTTITPNLGVAELSDYRTLTVADIPGIIEGASQGKGLGHDFLRHIERNRVLLFMLDLGDPDPMQTLNILENELAQHSPALIDRPRVYALNKADIPENRERFDDLKKKLPGAFLISGATGEGLTELLEALWALVDKSRKEEAAYVAPEPDVEYTYEAPFLIFQEPSGGYRIEGERVERLVRMTDFENEEALRHLQKVFTKMGLMRSLKRAGAKPGMSVFISGVELEYQPDELAGD